MKSRGQEAWSVGEEAVLSLNWLKSQFPGSKQRSEASSMLKSCLWLLLWQRRGFVTEEQSEKLLAGGAETTLL